MNTIKCASCGASNQLPIGKNSMFCAFCGNTIQKSTYTNGQNSNRNWPEISFEKVEIPFEKSNWYQKKGAEAKAKFEVAKRMIEMGVNTYDTIKNIEYYKTDGGYNAIIIKEKKNSHSAFPEEFRITEFVPIEYDSSKTKHILNLKNMGISSIKELNNHYDTESLNKLTDLNLSYNEISNWDGIEIFYNLKFLNLSNNFIEDLFDISNTTKLKWLNNIETINLKNNPIGNKYSESYEFVFNASNYNFKNGCIKKGALKVSCDNCQSEILSNTKNKYNGLCRRCHNLSSSGKNDVISNSKEVIDNDVINNKQSGKCFIATAAIGSYDHPQVMELRNFRDEWILTKNWGNSFVKWYYHYGEKAAKIIDKSFILKKISYLLIVKPLVYLSRIVKD